MRVVNDELSKNKKHNVINGKKKSESLKKEKNVKNQKKIDKVNSTISNFRNNKKDKKMFLNNTKKNILLFK